MARSAIGALIAPSFLHLGLPRQGIIRTAAVCHTLGHVAKLAVFGVAGFAFTQVAGPLALLAGAVVLDGLSFF